MTTLPEPARDAAWAARGEDLEDLGRVAGAQPWEPSGPTVSRADLDGPTEGPLARVAEVSARAQHHVRAEATAGLAALTFDAYCAGTTTVVVATASPTEVAGRQLAGTEVAEVADRLHVAELPTGWLPVELAGWLGVGPAWSADLAAPALPMATVTARVDDPETPVPDGAGDLLREAWHQDWTLWTVRAGSRGTIGVSAGRCGQLSLARDGDDAAAVHLQSWPSAQVWESLRSLCLDWEER